MCHGESLARWIKLKFFAYKKKTGRPFQKRAGPGSSMPAGQGGGSFERPTKQLEPFNMETAVKLEMKKRK